MKASLATYNVHPAGDRKASSGSRPSRSSGSPTRWAYSQDGAIFFWLGEDGRPEAAVQAFLMRDGTAGSTTSARSRPARSSPRRRAAGLVPRPGRGRVRPVPDAPKPADTAEARLRQMRELAAGLRRRRTTSGSNGWQALRPMPKPFARYGKPGSALIDGAVFCFALGTDPEAYLMLEARAGKDGPEWQYAFAPRPPTPSRRRGRAGRSGASPTASPGPRPKRSSAGPTGPRSEPA